MLDVTTKAPDAASPPPLKSVAFGDFPHYVDSSMRSTWAGCRRKSLWSAILALYPTGKSVHLIAGGAFAAGMEAARKRVFCDSSPASVSHQSVLHSAYVAFRREWGDYVAPENHAKSFVNTFCALDFYLTQHPPYTDCIQPVIRPDGTPAVEYTFAIPLEDCLHPTTNDPILFVGRFDLLGLYNSGEAQIPCICDEKTTYSMGIGWADSWDMRGQFIGYLWALRQQGWDVSHAAIRGVAIQKTQFKVETALPEYTDHLIERWHRAFTQDVKEMISAYKHWSTELREFGKESADAIAEVVYPYNFADACGSYGGCAFSTLCLQRDPEPFFTNYIRHRWNPLLKQPVEEIENA